MSTLSDFNFTYPPESVARQPMAPRDASGLWHLDRAGGGLKHYFFRDLPELLRAGDLIVLNDVRVLPVRLAARREHGGLSQVLVVAEGEGEGLHPESGVIPAGGHVYQALISRGKRIHAGSALDFGQGFTGEALADLGDGRWRIRVTAPPAGGDFFESCGEMPLPPYLDPKDRSADLLRQDRDKYQTVFAKSGGAIAAPTAGLHFTPEVFDHLKAKGIETQMLTLNVSFGTFRPIRLEDFRLHQLDTEHFSIPAQTAQAISRAKREGRRVIGVGTTVTRTLESSLMDQDQYEFKRSGATRLFIHSDYHFRCIDALLTNFHLPMSSLLLLVCAFAGRERVLEAYRQAIDQGARLFSYGDAMLIT